MPHVATSEGHFAYCCPAPGNRKLVEVFTLLKYPLPPKTKAPTLVIGHRDRRRQTALALPDQFIELERPFARNNVQFAPDGLTVAVALRSGVAVYDVY
jgi:hypothetical protein